MTESLLNSTKLQEAQKIPFNMFIVLKASKGPFATIKPKIGLKIMSRIIIKEAQVDDMDDRQEELTAKRKLKDLVELQENRKVRNRLMVCLPMQRTILLHSKDGYIPFERH